MGSSITTCRGQQAAWKYLGGGSQQVARLVSAALVVGTIEQLSGCSTAGATLDGAVLAEPVGVFQLSFNANQISGVLPMSRYFDVYITPISSGENRIYVGGLEAKGTGELLDELKKLLQRSETLEQWIHWGDGALSVELFVPDEKNPQVSQPQLTREAESPTAALS